jgi:cell division protein FtsA
MKGNIISAIDIGSSKITTLVAQVEYDLATQKPQINIVGVSSLPSRGVKKGQIVDIEDAVEATIESVEAAERMAGYNLDRAVISVGGAHVDSTNSSGVVAVSDPEGEISQDDVERVIDAARAISIPTSREIIHVLPRQFIVDGESGVRDPIGMSGIRLEVDTHIVTASAPALKNLSKTISEVGVDIDSTIFSALAASFACLSKTEKELGCAIVDIGAGTTSIAAYTDGALSYSGAIPIGAKNVTNDLAIGLRVSLEEAEKIKVMLSQTRKESKKSTQIEILEEGTGEKKKIYTRTLIEGIVGPRLNEIFTMIKLELERAELINKIPSGIILTGGGALTVGAINTAKRTLSLPSRVASPKGVKGITDEILTPQYSTPIGLLICSAGNQITPHKKTTLSVPKNIKIPKVNFIPKLVESIKDLLP